MANLAVTCMAIDPNDPNLIYAGTGEANNRNTSSWGGGVYKSHDGGDSGSCDNIYAYSRNIFKLIPMIGRNST